ncbi:MAG: hypothetical protein IJL98_01625 [Lachnospiraceae bacterium]|nr:hypothetical protein [Lachnospiraceae bacterium]
MTKRKKRLLTLILAVLYTLSSTMFSVYAAEDELPVAGTASYEESADEAAEETTEEVTEEEESSAEETGTEEVSEENGTEAEEISEETETEEISEEEESVTEEVSEETETETEEISEDTETEEEEVSEETETEAEEVSEEIETEAEEISEETETETEEISEDTETEAEEVSEETETEAEEISEETETEAEEVSEETETEAEEVSEETDAEEVSEEEESLTEEVSEETETEAEEISEETETEAEEISEETETEAEEVSEETETEEVSEETEETKTSDDSRNDSEPADSEEFIREPDAEIQEKPIAATIVVGSSYEAEIQNPGDYVYYKFIPASDGVFIFESNGDYDTYGYLYNVDWNTITDDDDSGEDRNFRITRELYKGVTYYFGVRFYSSSNTGIIPVSLRQMQTGWNQVGDDLCYIDEDGTYCTGKTTIDGKDYLFDGYGRLVRNDYASGGDDYYYLAGADGVVVTKTGRIKNNSGTYYINDSEGHLAKGWKKLSDKWYFFGPRMHHSGTSTIINSNDEAFVYLFRENGVLVTTVGWVQFDGRWYYVTKTSGELQTGLAHIGGSSYYFDEYDAHMYSDTVIELEGIVFVAAVNGKLTAAKNGWNKIGDYYYYLKDDEIVKSQVLQIGSYFYAFDYSGHMYDDSAFYLNGSYYRAKKGGQLYAKAWYEEYGSWYYYGEAGKAVSGVTTVGGKQYYFRYDGFMVSREVISDSENVYYAEASGVLRKLSNGWNLIDFGTYSGYYYVKDSSYYRNGVYEIGSAFYGFNYSGQMYDNNTFDWNGSYYRAREGGKLYVNAWYQAGGNWYYYGEGGKAPSGVTTVSGKKYLFSVDGRMITDGVGTDGTNVYYADHKGNLTQLSAGWNQINGIYYYVKDGAFLTYDVVKLGGAYYGFNNYGQMYDNEAFTFNGNYYRAKDGGQLYQSAWYKEGSAWYYYTEDGRAARDFRTIGGKKYYFNNNGVMLVNGAVTDYSGTPTAYYADESGSLTKLSEGWNKQGGDYYYVKNGVILTGLQKIGSSWYYFNSEGRMYDDEAFYVSYDYSSRAKKGGALYVNEWYQDGSDWYYYGGEGRSASGLTKIGSKYYYFSGDGRMMTETSLSADDAIYYFGSDGVAVKMAEGWNNYNGSYYYVADGKLVRGEVRKIGSYYYGFDYDGQMYDDTLFINYEQDASYYYRAKKGGKLYEKEWVQIGQEWYFYGTAGKAADGLATVGGKQYLFSYGRMRTDYGFLYEGKPYHADGNGVVSAVTETGLFRAGEYDYAGAALYYVSNGEIVRSSWKNINGRYYYFNESGAAYMNQGGVKIGDKLYAFDSEGRMFSGCWVRYANGYIGYAESSGALAVGEKKIGSKYYYFEAVSGRLLTGLVTYNGKTYLCGSDGAYIGTAKGNGWNEINGSWYYIVNNQPVTGRYAVGGVYYYFDYNGCMQKEQLIDSRVYGSDGKQVASGWYQLNGRYVYINKRGTIVYGIQVINGKEYYFDNGFMWVDERIIGNEKRIYGAGGALISTETMKNGWVLANGVYYYYKDGKPYTGWVGAYYIQNGIMLRNQEVDGYWLGQDGQYVKSGWVKLNSYSYKPGAYNGSYGYAKSNGKLAKDEWLKLGGNWYYFGGIYMMTGVQVVDGKVYQFSDTGVQTSVLLDKVKDGWLKVGSEYVFINNGMVVRSNTLKIGNYEYAFDSEGYMMRDSLFSYYADYYTYKIAYFGSDGKRAYYTGWKKLNGYWYYFDSSSCVTYGFALIDGKQYYFNYEMADSWALISGHLYDFGSDGVLTGQNTTQNGWVNKGGLWFYFRDGYAASGVQTVDGKVYAFGSSMIRNATFYNNGAYYFFGSDGVLAAKEGWKTDSEGYRYYTDATGRVLTGIRKIDGQTCYFDDYGRQIP